MRRFVWSRNLKNEEAMARVGPQRHGKKIIECKQKYDCRSKMLFSFVFDSDTQRTSEARHLQSGPQVLNYV